MTSVVLVMVEGGIVQDTIQLYGEVETITIDWDTIADGDGDSILDIARYKATIYPWREQVPSVWADLLKAEEDWLEGAESDSRLTYPRD